LYEDDFSQLNIILMMNDYRYLDRYTIANMYQYVHNAG